MESAKLKTDALSQPSAVWTNQNHIQMKLNTNTILGIQENYDEQNLDSHWLKLESSFSFKLKS